MNDLTFRQQLEKANAPDEVRQRLAAGNYGQQKSKIAQEYLDSLEREESANSSTRREAREKESLSISRKALRVSERANILAIAAMILSAATAIAVAIIQFIGDKTS